MEACSNSTKAAKTLCGVSVGRPHPVVIDGSRNANRNFRDVMVQVEESGNNDTPLHLKPVGGEGGTLRQGGRLGSREGVGGRQGRRQAGREGGREGGREEGGSS